MYVGAICFCAVIARRMRQLFEKMRQMKVYEDELVYLKQLSVSNEQALNDLLAMSEKVEQSTNETKEVTNFPYQLQMLYVTACRIKSLYKDLQGISDYADKKQDGNEALAEAFVRARNHETLPEHVTELLEKYYGRWKK